MKKELYVREIYLAPNGEVSSQGIGSPTVFVRFQGCHLRCYKKTKGVLCDTPQALEHAGKTPAEEMPVVGDPMSVLLAVQALSSDSLVKRVCLTGGDPLYQNSELLEELVQKLLAEGFSITVETSGTLDWEYLLKYENVSLVLDYKTHSAGVSNNLLSDPKKWANLRPNDYVKFVASDELDLEELYEALSHKEIWCSKARIAVGSYWGGSKILPSDLSEFLFERGLAGRVVMNCQMHKLNSLYERVLSLLDDNDDSPLAELFRTILEDISIEQLT
jgi:7-carboxy-7-deazaguanine synthase